MWAKYFLLVFILHATTINGIFRPMTKDRQYLPTNCNFGEPLILTPLLEKGNFKKAQDLAKVEPDIGNVTSYSGLLTVNKKCNSNIFFWFFPAQNTSWKDAPLLLWLQGGPGAPSTFGLFRELGPFKATKEGLEKRKYAWNVENNLLFIDQPVGTGYSYTGGDCYPTSGDEVGEDLYQAIVQFYKLFPQLTKNKFYASGESYAGHYIPALGHTIHKNNPTAKVKINLAAMAIGNGWVDPETQNNYGDYLYQLGLVDDKQREWFTKSDSSCRKHIQDQDWDGAVYPCLLSINVFYDMFVGNVSVYNYLESAFEDEPYWKMFLQTCETRRALHVGNLTFQGGSFNVRQNLFSDSVQSVKPWVEELLEIYPIIFFSGQLDIICAYPMSSRFISSLNWSGQDRYLNATRSKWCVDEEQAGYFKGEHRLYDVLVRGAGHMVPTDQPHWAYILINSITSGTPDNPLHALTNCDAND